MHRDPADTLRLSPRDHERWRLDWPACAPAYLDALEEAGEHAFLVNMLRKHRRGDRPYPFNMRVLGDSLPGTGAPSPAFRVHVRNGRALKILASVTAGHGASVDAWRWYYDINQLYADAVDGFANLADRAWVNRLLDPVRAAVYGALKDDEAGWPRVEELKRHVRATPPLDDGVVDEFTVKRRVGTRFEFMTERCVTAWSIELTSLDRASRERRGLSPEEEHHYATLP